MTIVIGLLPAALGINANPVVVNDCGYSMVSVPPDRHLRLVCVGMVNYIRKGFSHNLQQMDLFVWRQFAIVERVVETNGMRLLSIRLLGRHLDDDLHRPR